MFIGVNLTFMCMHFLGLVGMRRRIPDYADVFIDYNIISSWGSLLSVVSALLFISMIYLELSSLSISTNLSSGFNFSVLASVSLESQLQSHMSFHSYFLLPLGGL
jgi:heme/copper-type cytochrome/quinol oxidase subunit 1